MTSRYLRPLLLAALTLSASHAHAATFRIGGAAPKPGGVMAQVVFRESSVDMSDRSFTTEEFDQTLAVGPFHFSGDTPGRFNINFQNSRAIRNVPELLAKHRVSFYSARREGGRVRLIVQVERMMDESWETVGMATADVPEDDPRVDLTVIPQGEHFHSSQEGLRFLEIGIRLRPRAQPASEAAAQ